MAKRSFLDYAESRLAAAEEVLRVSALGSTANKAQLNAL